MSKIYKNIKYKLSAAMLTLLMLASACTDEQIVPQNTFYQGNGKLTDLKLKMMYPEVEVKSRAMLNDDQERVVNNIYVLMFRKESANDTNPKVMNDVRYFTKDQIKSVQAEANHFNAGLVEITNIPTGTYYIAAVANVEGGDVEGQDLMAKLDAVKDFEEFQAVSVHLGEATNLSRTLLTMSGYYLGEESDSEHAQHTNPDIPHSGETPHDAKVTQSGQLDGYIHLRRIDARVHFDIINGMDNTNKFRIKSWQLVNIPKFVSVIEEHQDLATNSDDFTKTIVYTSGWTEEGTTGVGDVMHSYALDFYMFENRGMSKYAITDYKLRELEEKKPADENGFEKNYEDPQYINAPQNSAYLILEAAFTQDMPDGDGGTYMRDVTSKYVIHLGYCEDDAKSPEGGDPHKANDFNTRRNTKYNYRVTINGADDIVVEAKKETMDYNHGAEGTVIDVIGGRLYDLDAHYSVFNIVITPKQLAESHLIIESPMGKWSTLVNDGLLQPDIYTEDYQHLRIAYNHEGTLQYHRATGTPEEKFNAVTKLVSYSKTYDYDCLGSTIPTYANSSLIPIHHERKVARDPNHQEPLYDFNSFKNMYGWPFLAERLWDDGAAIAVSDVSIYYNGNQHRILNDVIYDVLGIDSDKSFGDPSAPEKTPLVFTVFVNEFYYYYNDGVINHDEGYNSDGTLDESKETPRDYTMWTKFVNQKHGRTYTLLAEIEDSKDDDSHYLTTSVRIQQRSIETYFGEHILDGYSKDDPNLPSALGLEQINEHEYKNLAAKNYTYDSRNTDANGYQVTMSQLTRADRTHSTYGASNTWNYHADQETIMGINPRTNHNDGHTYPLFATRSAQMIFNNPSNQDYSYKTKGFIANGDQDNYEVVDVPLNRNRDLNRDGYITADEVRWFAPSSAQYVTFCVGAGALQTPLFMNTMFDPSKTYWQVWPINYNYKKVYYNGHFHYIGTNKWYTITEEGSSTGSSAWTDDRITGTGDGLDTQLSGQMRCARYLGVNKGDNGYQGLVLPEPASFNQQNYVINTVNYSKQMHRSPTSGRIPPHTDMSIGSNGWNSLSDYFQVSTTNSNLSTQNVGGTNSDGDNLNAEDYLIWRMDQNEYCKNYVDPKFGAGGWRTPNQVELAMMYNYMPANLLNLGSVDANYPGNANLLSCTYWYRNEELAAQGSTAWEGETKTVSGKVLKRHFLGARVDGEGRKLSMLHATNLYHNKYYTVRCVRDTDKDGNWRGAAEYGNPVNFKAEDFGCTYNNDGTATYQVNASMTAANVLSATVVIDGYGATTTGSGTVHSLVSGATVRTNEVTVVWTIRTIDGKTLTYRKSYELPARYWLISRYGVDKRYATINQDNARTYVGNTDTRNVDQIEAIYKWVLTKSTGNIVNESELNTTDTYYLYNAGTQTFINGIGSGNQTYMTTGASNAIPVKLQLRSGYDGYYVIRLNNSTNANSHGGNAGNFGVWNGVDDGSTYKLTPAVVRGEMPFTFSAGTFVTNYSQTDGTKATYTSDATYDPSTGEFVSVTINGTSVTPTLSSGNIHTVLPDAAIREDGQAEVVWRFRRDGDIITKTHTYELPVKFYLIESILSNASWGYQYAYADTDNRTKANPFTAEQDKSRMPLKYRWILSGDTQSATQNIYASELVVNANRQMYLYNVGAQGYVAYPAGHSSSIYDTFPIGATGHRFCFDAAKNGGFRPFFRWDGTNGYGSCVNGSRQHVKTKFGISPAGMDGAYWKFIPVYIDNGPASE